MRGIIEFDLDHGRSLGRGNPEHGLVVQHDGIVVIRIVAYGERQGDALDVGSWEVRRGSAQQ